MLATAVAFLFVVMLLAEVTRPMRKRWELNAHRWELARYERFLEHAITPEERRVYEKAIADCHRRMRRCR